MTYLFEKSDQKKVRILNAAAKDFMGVLERRKRESPKQLGPRGQAFELALEIVIEDTKAMQGDDKL